MSFSTSKRPKNKSAFGRLLKFGHAGKDGLKEKEAAAAAAKQEKEKRASSHNNNYNSRALLSEEFFISKSQSVGRNVQNGGLLGTSSSMGGSMQQIGQTRDLSGMMDGSGRSDTSSGSSRTNHNNDNKTTSSSTTKLPPRQMKGKSRRQQKVHDFLLQRPESAPDHNNNNRLLSSKNAARITPNHSNSTNATRSTNTNPAEEEVLDETSQESFSSQDGTAFVGMNDSMQVNLRRRTALPPESHPRQQLSLRSTGGSSQQPQRMLHRQGSSSIEEEESDEHTASSAETDSRDGGATKLVAASAVSAVSASTPPTTRSVPVNLTSILTRSSTISNGTSSDSEEDDDDNAPHRGVRKTVSFASGDNLETRIMIQTSNTYDILETPEVDKPRPSTKPNPRTHRSIFSTRQQTADDEDAFNEAFLLLDESMTTTPDATTNNSSTQRMNSQQKQRYQEQRYRAEQVLIMQQTRQLYKENREELLASQPTTIVWATPDELEQLRHQRKRLLGVRKGTRRKRTKARKRRTEIRGILATEALAAAQHRKDRIIAQYKMAAPNALEHRRRRMVKSVLARSALAVVLFQKQHLHWQTVVEAAQARDQRLEARRQAYRKAFKLATSRKSGGIRPAIRLQVMNDAVEVAQERLRGLVVEEVWREPPIVPFGRTTVPTGETDSEFSSSSSESSDSEEESIPDDSSNCYTDESDHEEEVVAEEELSPAWDDTEDPAFAQLEAEIYGFLGAAREAAERVQQKWPVKRDDSEEITNQIEV